MRFTEEVVLFDFAGIPMVGCLGTGYAIGLTEQGAAVCARMLEEDVPEDDVTAVPPHLKEKPFIFFQIRDANCLAPTPRTCKYRRFRFSISDILSV